MGAEDGEVRTQKTRPWARKTPVTHPGQRLRPTSCERELEAPLSQTGSQGLADAGGRACGVTLSCCSEPHFATGSDIPMREGE